MHTLLKTILQQNLISLNLKQSKTKPRRRTVKIFSIYVLVNNFCNTTFKTIKMQKIVNIKINVLRITFRLN